MKTDEALAAEQAVEAKLADAGANEVRRHTFESEPEAASEPETPAEEPITEETAVEEPADAVAAAVLSKYGNDPQKLAQAHAALQRKLGEQGTELGREREQNAELEQVLAELAAIKEQISQPQTSPIPDQATVDWVDEQISLNPAAAPQFAAQALQQNQPLLYQRVMRTWFDHDAYAATEFSNAVRFEQVKQELATQAPARDEGVQMQAALSQVLSDNPEFTQYADGLEAVITRYPDTAKGLQGSQDEKVRSITTLFALAERDTLRAIALSGNTPVAPSTASEVATTTTSQEHPEEAPAPPSKLDVFRQEFREEAARYGGERAIPGAFVARP